MTEKEKMLSGRLYDPSDVELSALRRRSHGLSQDYNRTYDWETEKRGEILDQLLPNRGPGVYLQGPIQFDYGCFTTIGENSYVNFNFTCLDCCPVEIGANVFIGPNVSLLTPLHPLRWQERNAFRRADGQMSNLEYARPIKIGDNCWIAGSVSICAGVTIGDGCVIGAGSVVTRDLPPGVLAAGAPCAVIRRITEKDQMEAR